MRTVIEYEPVVLGNEPSESEAELREKFFKPLRNSLR